MEKNLIQFWFQSVVGSVRNFEQVELAGKQCSVCQ